MNFSIFEVFQKNENFMGNEDFVIFWGSSQNWTCFRGLFYAFEDPVLRSTYRMGIFLEVAKISNTFFWFLILLIFIFFCKQ